MSTLYLVALGGVCLVLMFLLWESLSAVSRAPVWPAQRLALMPLSRTELATAPALAVTTATTAIGPARPFFPVPAVPALAAAWHPVSAPEPRGESADALALAG